MTPTDAGCILAPTMQLGAHPLGWGDRRIAHYKPYVTLGERAVLTDSMRHTLCRALGPTVAAAGLALGGSVAPADAETAAAGQQVAAYMSNQHVDRPTAERNLERQDRGGQLPAALRAALENQYGGLWFDNQSGRFTVAIAGDRKSKAEKVVADHGLADATSYVAVKYGEDQLMNTEHELFDTLQPEFRSAVVEMHISPGADLVDVGTAPTISESQRDDVEAAAQRYGDRARVVKSPASDFGVAPASALCGTISSNPYCDHPLRGGVGLNDAVTGKQCSMADWGILGTTRYIITAGHCNNTLPNGQWYSNDLGFVGSPSEYVGTRYDQRENWEGDISLIAESPSSTWASGDQTAEAVIWGYANEWTYTSVGWPYVGEQVCWSGRNSTGCGYVNSVGYSTTYNDGTAVGNLVKVTHDFGCVVPGTSGGPVMDGQGIYGVVDAVDGNCDWYFTPILKSASIWGVGPAGP